MSVDSIPLELAQFGEVMHRAKQSWALVMTRETAAPTIWKDPQTGALPQSLFIASPHSLGLSFSPFIGDAASTWLFGTDDAL
jgi:hypothetical protein